jgi:hypothetical protein
MTQLLVSTVATEGVAFRVIARVVVLVVEQLKMPMGVEEESIGRRVPSRIVR